LGKRGSEASIEREGKERSVSVSSFGSLTGGMKEVREWLGGRRVERG
jgi:hypothetical protein